MVCTLDERILVPRVIGSPMSSLWLGGWGFGVLYGVSYGHKRNNRIVPYLPVEFTGKDFQRHRVDTSLRLSRRTKECVAFGGLHTRTLRDRGLRT